MKQLTLLALIPATLMACSSYSDKKSTKMASNTDMDKPAMVDNSMSDMEAAKAEALDVVGIASSDAQFSTLVTAIQAAGLVEALQGDGPFTVFAPTNAAFEKLPPGTVEALLADKEKLTQILTYHVVSGKVMAADVGGLSSATTLQGQALAIDTQNGVKIGNAGVIATDIEAQNGVIHVIDTVLIPE